MRSVRNGRCNEGDANRENGYGFISQCCCKKDSNDVLSQKRDLSREQILSP